MITFWMCAAIAGFLGILTIWLWHQYHVKDLKMDIGTLSDVNEKLNVEVGQKDDSIARLFEMIESISGERTMYRTRALQVEDAIEKGYGVTIRKEVTKIIVDFNKLEMVVFLAGVNKLLKNSSNVGDAEFYINLIKRLQSIIDKMEEPEEEKE